MQLAFRILWVLQLSLVLHPQDQAQGDLSQRIASITAALDSLLNTASDDDWYWIDAF